MMAEYGQPGRSSAALYRTLWRWHFYAGLIVLPFILILSVTGSIYLFKPQIDRWEERAYRHLPAAGAVSPDAQGTAALVAYPRAAFNAYRLPEGAGDAAMIQLRLADGSQREVFVTPQGKVVGALDPDARTSAIVAAIHGSLLLGTWGDRLVELGASWTIVTILAGLYLWWPRPFRLAGTIWPRIGLRGRPFLKDLHRVAGFWIAGLVLLMLASGLPWASTWGGAFKWVRAELGLVQGTQDWKVGATQHAGHEVGRPMSTPAHASAMPAGLPLSAFVAKARDERMAFPVLVIPPHASQRFGPPSGNVWTVKSETQNRPLTRQVTYDPLTGHEVGRTSFADKRVVDSIVNNGIAWHEGQLFGLANQLLGLLTALALIVLSVVGVTMWLKRRPQGSLGAPPPVAEALPHWCKASILIAGILLPLFGGSLLLLLLCDWLVRRAASMLLRNRPTGG